jgi:hypothetical protein
MDPRRRRNSDKVMRKVNEYVDDGPMSEVISYFSSNSSITRTVKGDTRIQKTKGDPFYSKRERERERERE